MADPTTVGMPRTICGLFCDLRPVIWDRRLQPANNSVFETTGNNVAMRAATGKYVVLMQDDMYLSQHGWNSVMARGPRQYADTVYS